MLKRFLFPLIVLLILFSPRPVSAASTVIRVAFTPGLPPYQFKDNGQFVGLHMDLLDSIARMSDLLLEYYPMATTSACMEALRQGEVDLVLGVVNNQISFLDYGMYTQMLSQSSICIVVQNRNLERALDSTRMITATYQDATISIPFIHSFKRMHTIPVSSQERALQMLVEGKADALVGVRASVLYQLDRMGLSGQYTIARNFMLPIEFSMMVRQGDNELLVKLNAANQQLRINGDYERIHDRWIPQESFFKTALFRIFVTIAGVVVAGLLIMFFFNYRLNHLLKRQVDQKTRDLRRQVTETRHSNELNSRIIENSPNAMIAFDRNMIVTLINPAANRLLSPTPQVGESVLDNPLMKRILNEKQDAMFQEDQLFVRQEILFHEENQPETHYRYNIYPLYNSGVGEGKQIARGAIITILDITQEFLLKEQMAEKQKNQALNRIIASIAHEIRNPLMGIKTYAELLPEKHGNAAFQQRMSTYVPQEVDRLNSLITNLIDYAKPRPVNREEVSLEELIDLCIMLVAPTAEKKGFAFRSNLTGGLVILADRGQLEQAFINILLNGLEAMEARVEETGIESGELAIEISTMADQWYIYIEVVDQGTGMDEEEIARAAEPFFTTKARGTGLGLSLSKQMVEDNGGRLQIESEQGRYTRVSMRFERQLGKEGAS